jgi:hypothetical protein
MTEPGRWELLRALGAVADSPAAARAVAPALGLPPLSDTGHTEAFVLNLPPYAAVYLGPDGALGGEGADRVAGFWRALAITPPPEPDHLAALLALYANLGEAAASATSAATAAALNRSRAALLAEHLWPWLPAYLDAATDLGLPALTGWAELTRRALTAEHQQDPGLPLALREAPAPPSAQTPPRDLIAALTTPPASGIILTRRRLAQGAGQASVGHRIGERRFTLRAMLEQDPAATLAWLAAEAHGWRSRHATRPDHTSQWWATRAGHTATVLDALTA